jgi:hypothetical protein
MADDYDHRACVNAWMDRVTKDLPPERLLNAFEHGFAALWRRAHQTLGDVTLTAIVDRVLFTAAEQYPFVASLKIEATGLRSHELDERAGSLQRDEVVEGVRFVLVEVLTVLGNLTAEILTPALHEELSKATETIPDENVSASRANRRTNREDPES